MSGAGQDSEAGRRRHYGEFYGLRPPGDEETPVVVVHGNCQAEALRVVIEASTDAVRTVRIPPVHELTEHDLPHLGRLLERAAVLVSQPVRDAYRDLPIGTSELAQGRRLQVVRWPAVRYVGLHPHTVIVRHPWFGDPPAVPYHDLRTILAAARGTGAADRPPGHRSPEGFRAVAAASLGELQRREVEGGLVPASDLVEAAGARAALAVNHPGNEVLVPLAGRIMQAFGVAEGPRDPGRVLLSSIVAPRDADVLTALGLDPSTATPRWQTPAGPVDDAAVARVQYPWYAERPRLIDVVRRRFAATIEALGL